MKPRLAKLVKKNYLNIFVFWGRRYLPQNVLYVQLYAVQKHANSERRYKWSLSMPALIILLLLESIIDEVHTSCLCVCACVFTLHTAPLCSPLQFLLSHPAESPPSFWAKTMCSFSNFLSLCLLHNSAAQSLITISKEEECISLYTWECVWVHVCVCVSTTCLCVYMKCWMHISRNTACKRRLGVCRCVRKCVCVQWMSDTASVCRNLSSLLAGCVLLFGPGCVLVLPVTHCSLSTSWHIYNKIR